MKVIFTCGGTAGHVNPALALAGYMREKDAGTQILFVGAERGLERDLIAHTDYPFRTVNISSFHRSFRLAEIKHNLVSLKNLAHAEREANAILKDFRPDLIVGDFDSAPQPKTEHETIVLPHVKDDTDTQYAAHWLLEHGYDEITLLGALGGARLEHTLANLATGLYLAKNGVNVLLANERSELRYLVPDRELILQRRDWKYLSLFPMEGRLTGVCIRGAFYPLENAVLTADYPLGVSNEFIADTAQLQCSGGCGLVVLTRDDA